jgi:putative membrane protein
MSGLARRRFPGFVYEQGDEPDPRFSLANERTFLAWLRTATALLAGAVALQAVETSLADPIRTALVMVLLVLAMSCAGTALVRWASAERSLRTRSPLPGMGGVAAVCLLVVLGVSVALMGAAPR